MLLNNPFPKFHKPPSFDTIHQPNTFIISNTSIKIQAEFRLEAFNFELETFGMKLEAFWVRDIR